MDVSGGSSTLLMECLEFRIFELNQFSEHKCASSSEEYWGLSCFREIRKIQGTSEILFISKPHAYQVL